MNIVGLEGMSVEQVQRELERGGKFVVYEYCISVIFMTFQNPTDIYFLRSDESDVVKGLPFCLVSLILGWWGFPWGPIYTFVSLFTNLSGGKEVTDDVVRILNATMAAQAPAA